MKKYTSPAEDLQENLKKAIGEILGKEEDFEKKIPSKCRVVQSKVKEKYRGDLSSEIPFSLAKYLRCSPMEAGRRVTKILKRQEYYEYVDLVLPGFINVGLKNDYLQAKMFDLLDAMEDEKLFPIEPVGEEGKILFEYVSANPTGPLHVGHGRWAVVGDVLSRILKKVKGDDKVHREFYVNDAGNQIKTLLQSVKNIREGKPVDEDGYHGEYLQRFAEDKNKSLDPVETLLEEQKEDLKGISVEFDEFFHETKLGDEYYFNSYIKVMMDKGLAYKKDGAVWFRSTDGGDTKDRVLVKSDGSYTYFCVDVLYHHSKIARGYFHLINLFGSDHHGYVKRLEVACKRIIKEEQGTADGFCMQNLLGQQVNLLRNGAPVKMSKRSGDIVTLKEVVDEVGVDAFRYFMCMRSIDQTVDFDLDEVKEKNMENPVVYLQYAYARCCAIARKAKELGLEPEMNDDCLFSQPSIRLMMSEMLHFPTVLKSISSNLKVHILPQYLYGVVSIFHSVYSNVCFIDTTNPEQTKQYLLFLHFFRRFLKESFEIMGISAPEKM